MTIISLNTEVLWHLLSEMEDKLNKTCSKISYIFSLYQVPAKALFPLSAKYEIFSYLALVTAQHQRIPTNLYTKDVCVWVNSQCCVDMLYKNGWE